jgi:crossover junction endodeoxyribonuclease RuvC
MANPAIIGLDLSLTSTGVAYADTQVSLRTTSKGPQRLHELWVLLETTISAINDPLVVVEGYSYSSRNSQSHSIGELGGVIRVELWRRNIPYIVVAPTARAKFATGRGNASKIEVMSAISAKTGITWSGSGADDMCDAWILQEMGLTAFGTPRFEWPKVSVDVVNAIDWMGSGIDNES